MIVNTNIESAFDKLAKETDACQTVQIALINAQSVLDHLVAEARHNGALEGKKEKDREAHAMVKFEMEYEAVQSAQVAHKKAKILEDLAKIEVDKIKYTIRLMEASA